MLKTSTLLHPRLYHPSWQCVSYGHTFSKTQIFTMYFSQSRLTAYLFILVKNIWASIVALTNKAAMHIDIW